jgi:KipI family sensor histidine kinase inhibitor
VIALEPLGDRAFLARFESERAAQAWSAAVRKAAWPGVVDIVAAYRSAAVYADPDRIDLERLERGLRAIKPAREDRAPGRLIELPVLYRGEDMGEVAGRFGVSEQEVVDRHTATTYDVFAIGFQPGFPYAGYLPASLCGLARRATPRLKVPAGSVAIAGRQTGVYPTASPGGWHLLGQTPLRIVDLEHGHFPIRAGDRLRFIPIAEPEYLRRQGELLDVNRRS